MIAQVTTVDQASALVDKLPRLLAELHKVVVGQQLVLEELLVAMLAGGHALLEGVPGLAKTLMVRTMAQAMAVNFKRVQFTPDLMPSDILGTEILEEDATTGRRSLVYRPGPVFTNLLLADEINRTPAKTQAALLEAMQEYAVTAGGVSYALPRPFFLLATQNPIEQAGTYPLPEAQLDRFLLYVRVGYPTELEELAILQATTGTTLPTIEPILTGEELIALQLLVRQVHVDEAIVRLAARLVRTTRPSPTAPATVQKSIAWGAGPRAGQALLLTAKAYALLQGRMSVIPADITRMAPPALRHRILLNYTAQAEGLQVDELIVQLLQQVQRG